MGERSATPRREHAEILTIIRFEERELVLPIGVASIEEDDIGRQVVSLRLALVNQRAFLPLWDILVLAGIDPRVVGRYLRRRDSARRPAGTG